jgi:hypothetical protein
MLVNFFSPFLLIFQVTNKKGEMARAFTCLCAAAVVAGVALPSPSSFPPDLPFVFSLCRLEAMGGPPNIYF